MSLVGVTRLPDTTLEADPTLLLYHVRRLVSCDVEARLVLESDLVAGRVGFGAHLRGCDRRVATDVSLDVRDVVVPERCLDLVAMGQCVARPSDAAFRGGLDRAGSATGAGLALGRCQGKRLAEELQHAVVATGHVV